MKYVLLDTNIIIDMVVDRRNQMSDKILKDFIKLLDYDEIKLIVPEVVEYETYKHLDGELKQVGKNIQKAMDKIKDLYGIATYKIQGLDIEEYKKEARKQLKQALEMFSQKKEQYKKELFQIIQEVFEHRNSIRVTGDSFLYEKVFKRRIYGRAPFHKELKESYADGLITEILINLTKFLELNEDDKIYFVTGNYKDFCDTEHDKTKLHPNILEDLKSQGIDEQVTYISNFGQLIKVELEDNVKTAQLTEEFEIDLRQQQEEEIWENDYKDMIRESAGLSSLSSFNSQMEDNLVDSEFYQDIINAFERINKCYEDAEEISCFYEDLMEFLDKSDLSKVQEIVDTFKKLFSEYKIDNIEDDKVSDLKKIFEWIEKQKNILGEFSYEKHIQDYFDFGDKVDITDCNGEEFCLDLEELYLSPADGSIDTIEIKVSNKNREVSVEGHIEVNYGFIEYNSDGGVADGCEEEINYHCQNIVDFVENCADEWENFILEQKRIKKYLKKWCIINNS